MGRLRGSDKGFTLLELVIAIALSAVVLLSASNLLINFGKFSANVVKSESSLMGTALGTFEEIVGKITAANEVAINKASPEAVLNSISYPASATADGSCIQIRIDNSNTPSDYTDDTVYTYWLNAGNLRRTGVTGDDAAGRVIAKDIFSLLFQRDGTYKNRITVTLEAQAASGPKGEKSKEHLVTTATMQARSAN